MCVFVVGVCVCLWSVCVCVCGQCVCVFVVGVCVCLWPGSVCVCVFLVVCLLVVGNASMIDLLLYVITVGKLYESRTLASRRSDKKNN